MNSVIGYISAPTDEFPPPSFVGGDSEPASPRVFRERLGLSVASLRVGESVFTDIASSHVNTDIRNFERSLGVKFAIRSQEGGTRIWRVK